MFLIDLHILEVYDSDVIFWVRHWSSAERSGDFVDRRSAGTKRTLFEFSDVVGILFSGT